MTKLLIALGVISVLETAYIVCDFIFGLTPTIKAFFAAL